MEMFERESVSFNKIGEDAMVTKVEVVRFKQLVKIL